LDESATTLLALGDTDGALQAAKQSQLIVQDLLLSDPGNAGWQRDLAVSHYKVAVVLSGQGEETLALSKFRQGRLIIARLKEHSPDSATLAKDLARFDAEIAKLAQASVVEPKAVQPQQATR
jgi:hypothetical protein